MLLLDDPLSALDLKLRQHMQLELRAIQRKLGATFVYVTHDQTEALVMSDRIAIMRTADARGREAGLSFADYQDWRRDARVFDGPTEAFAIATLSRGGEGATTGQDDGL